MERYNQHAGYRLFSGFIALTNVCLQLILVSYLFHLALDPLWGIALFFAALYLTDLINGFVHLVMDHQDDYTSLVGPLVASFHLHHKIPVYRRRPLILVYIVESGIKIWLVLYLILVWTLLHFGSPWPPLSYLLILIGVLSSVAEVSHYLCHSSRSPLARWLARLGLLLSKQHHADHHTLDNRNYAFLNGWSDPLLNVIAAHFFSGYKQNTDLHYLHYEPADLTRR